MELHLTRRKKAGLIVGTAALAALGVAGAAIGSSDDDATEKPITGPALEKATDAALAETGGGRVTGTEVGDEESMYEVEVTLSNGDQVDVQLDENFRVVGSESDSESDSDE